MGARESDSELLPDGYLGSMFDAEDAERIVRSSEPTPFDILFWRLKSGAPVRARKRPHVPGPGAPDACPSWGFKMTPREFGPWEPLSITSVVAAFSSARFQWWIGGGHALDLALGRTWRLHEDTDVGVGRRDLGALHTLLSGWDLHVAAAGELTSWRGEPLDVGRHQNNVWCRLTPDGPWVLDLTISEGSDRDWIYRRDRSVVVPWDVAIQRTADGIPFLAPELQLLYKSKDLRAKDDVDAVDVIPNLDGRQRTFLSCLLPPDHPWQRRLG